MSESLLTMLIAAFLIAAIVVPYALRPDGENARPEPGSKK